VCEIRNNYGECIVRSYHQEGKNPSITNLVFDYSNNTGELRCMNWVKLISSECFICKNSFQPERLNPEDTRNSVSDSLNNANN